MLAPMARVLSAVSFKSFPGKAFINVGRSFRTNTPFVPGGAFGLSGAPPSTMVGDPYPPGTTHADAEAAMEITGSDVTLDFILDERTREFYGESVRRLDLVRTKSLVTRVMAWKPTEAVTNVKPEYMLRAIPQDQIERVTEGPRYPKNPGY